METPKNPARVPWLSQVVNPVGPEPGGEKGGVMITREGDQNQRKIETTGNYTDGQGNQFFFRAGHVIPDGAEYKLVEPADLNRSGAPERRDAAFAANPNHALVDVPAFVNESNPEPEPVPKPEPNPEPEPAPKKGNDKKAAS